MKNNIKQQNIWLTIMLIVSSIYSGIASAGLMNADFSDGLTGWGGQVSYYDISIDTEFYFQDVTDFAQYSTNFMTSANSVTLNTSADSNTENFAIYLFQEFIVGDNASMLSLAFDFVADDPNAVYATLVNDNGDLLHDFINDTSLVDISQWVGSLVSIEFGLEDWDYNYNEHLTISDISLSTTSVPEPSTVLLFLIAISVLIRRSAKTQIFSRLNPVIK